MSPTPIPQVLTVNRVGLRCRVNPVGYWRMHSAVKRLFIWRLYPFIIRFYLLKGVYLVFIVNSVF